MATAVASLNQLNPFVAGVFTGAKNPLEVWTGNLRGPHGYYQQEPTEGRGYTSWNYTDAFKGQSTRLRDTVTDEVFVVENWYTTAALPIMPMETPEVSWTNLTARAALLGITPYQSTSRTLTQTRSMRTAVMIRRGIRAQFESDFLTTQMGLISFNAAMRQIVNSTRQTMMVNVIRALLGGHEYQQHWFKEYGIIARGKLMQFLERDRARFALVQKGKNAMEKVGVEISLEMANWGGSANAWIMDEQVSAHLELVPPEKTDQWLAGVFGPQRVNGTIQQRVAAANLQSPLDHIEPLRMVKDTPVYLTRAFEVENYGRLDMMHRSRQIGEFNTMLIPDDIDPATYTSKCRAIRIYDEDKDNMVPITLEDALQHTGLFDSQGRLINPFAQLSPAQLTDEMRRDPFVMQMADGKLESIAKIGDMDPELFLRPKELRFCVQTFVQALKKRGGPAFMDAWKTITTMANPASIQVEEIQTVYNVIAGVLGVNNNAVLNSIADLISFIRGVSPLVRNEAAPPATPPAAQQEEEEEALESKIGSAYLNVLVAQVPKSHRLQADEIVADEGRSVEQRGVAIRDLLMDYVEQKQGSIHPSLDTVHKIKEWHGTRQTKYREQMEKASTTTRSAGGRGASILDLGNGIVLAAPGQNLAGTGYRYKYEEDAHRSPRAPGQLPETWEEMPHVRAQLYEERQKYQPRAAAAAPEVSRMGAGLGLAGIGALDFGERDPREEIRDAGIREMYARRRNDGMIQEHMYRINQSGYDFFTRAMAVVFLNQAFTRETMERFVAANICPPINILLFRPHMQYDMSIAIKMLMGGGTGVTGWAQANMQMGIEPGRKIQEAHFTVHTDSFVTNPENDYVLPDIFSRGNEGGAGSTFFDAKTYRSMRNMRYDHVPASLLAVAVAPSERTFGLNGVVMDTSGQFHTEYLLGLQTIQEFQELHYTTAARYNSLYGFYTDLGVLNTSHPTLDLNHYIDNRQMWHGEQDQWNPTTGWYTAVKNTGHWGAVVGYGARAVRRGEMVHISDNQYWKR